MIGLYEEHFRFPELVEVTNLASARAAIETIVEQGEGARGEWKQSHFGKLLGVLEQLVAAKAADPEFEPTRPVLAAHVRPPESGVSVPLITASNGHARRSTSAETSGGQPRCGGAARGLA